MLRASSNGSDVLNRDYEYEAAAQSSEHMRRDETQTQSSYRNTEIGYLSGTV